MGAPVAVLLVAQLTFRAYHSGPVTWVQRLCLIADLGLIWFFWNRIRGGGDRSWPRVARWLREGLSVAMTVAVTGFSLVVAYFPGEAVERRLDHLPFGLGADRAGVRWLNAALFGTDADVPSGRRVAVLSNRLVLANQRFTQDAVGGRPPLGRSLRDRDLNHAVFDRSDLTGADFSGADLSHARFVEATLDGAKFYSANLSDVRAQFARLSNANLPLATMKNARLLHANLVGARFTGSTLDLSHLGHSNLSGATFYSATLPGVRFSDAVLDGAVFRDTDLRGASFAGARLRGADFVNSCLGLADFHGADLRGSRIRAPSEDPARNAPQFLKDLQLAQSDGYAVRDCSAKTITGADFSGANGLERR